MRIQSGPRASPSHAQGRLILQRCTEWHARTMANCIITSFDNFESIMKDKVLKPGMGPLDDGTVNYTGNPNFHRFGAIRLVFDSSIKDRLIPMCYVRGEDMAILSNAVS